MTAAVPHANTSLIEPSWQPSRHSCALMRPCSTVSPSAGAIVSSESRTTPGSSVPVRAGVNRVVPRTKNRFIPPISSTQRRSTASSQTTWSQPISAACRWASRLPA